MGVSAGRIDFRSRPRIVSGDGALDDLGEWVREAGARRALVVSDPGVVRAGPAGAAVEAIAKAGGEARLFAGVVENPTEACAERGAAAARDARAEAIVGVGGGSAMDCAKGIAILLALGGPLGKLDLRPSRSLAAGDGDGAPFLPLVLAPTTAGTGSEVQSAALISRDGTGEKMLFRDPRLLARTAVLDPRTTATAPRRVTAAAGIDAVAHAVESRVSAASTAISRMFAREAFRLLAGALPGTLAAPADPAARSDMLLGASLAGLSVENSMLGAAHSCANPLAHARAVPHGIAVGLMLPHVIRFNGTSPDAERGYADLLAAAGIAAGGRGPAATLAALVEDFLERAGLPRTLRELEVEEAALPDLAGEAASQFTAAFNPRPVTAANLQEVYRWAW